MSSTSPSWLVGTAAVAALLSSVARGQFYAPLTLVANQGPGGLEIADMDVADLDNDGDMDFVLASVGASPIYWLRNNGIGYSLLQIPSTNNLNGQRAVHAADMDGDGDVDILFGAAGAYGGPVIQGSNSQLRIYRNDGSGTFTGTNIFYAGNFGSFSRGAKGVNHLTSADMDGDGDLDIVMCQGVDASFGLNWDRVVWIVNDGTPNFGATRTIDPGSAGDVPRRADAADVDGDGDVDLVVAYAGSDELVCWKNPGAGTGSWTFSVLRSNERSLDAQVGDLDGDGDLDVVATHAGGKVATYAGDGAGGFAPQQVVGTVGADGGAVAVDDLDGDGDLDVFAGPRLTVPGVTGDLVFFEAQGAGAFGPAQVVESGTLTRAIRFADLNADGQRDLVVADSVGLRFYETTFDPNAAAKETYGASCASAAASFYEVLSPQAMDLSGMAIQGVSNGAGFDVTVGPSSIVPVGAGAKLLNLSSNGFSFLSTPSATGGADASWPLAVSANGFVSIISPQLPQTPPFQVADLLDHTRETFAAWTDLEPATASWGGSFSTRIQAEVGTLGSFLAGVPAPSSVTQTSTPHVLYSAFGQYSLRGSLTLPHAAGSATYVVNVRYLSNAGAELKLEEAGGGPGSLYQQLVLPPTQVWSTASFSVSLPDSLNPALVFDPASAGSVRVDWVDISTPPPTSGGVYYEELAGGLARVTYDGVAGQGTGGANTLQFTFQLSGSGASNVNVNSFSIAFGALSTSNPEPWLVGYSPAGPNLDPGPSDLSAAAFSTGSEDVKISLDGGYPRLGSAWSVTLADYGSQTTGFLFIGDTRYDPGIPLGGLGAPGCSVYTSANLSALLQFMSNGSSTRVIPIPNNAALVGAELALQSTALASLNAFGLATSNGLYARVGN